MNLIAESGSSRTEWCITEGGYLIDRGFTDGINPYFQTRKEISRCIRLQLPESFFTKKIAQIYFYGAGCTNEDKKNTVKASVVAQFRSPAIIYSDLLAAARSLFKETSGIACILGTGSNSCFYDGSDIVKNVRSLGFILGDEGSGAVLGKLFLSDCLKGLADPYVTRKFFDLYRINAEDILEFVYNEPLPNKFLSTISFFLADNRDNDYVNNLIRQNIKNFFTRNILQYEYKDYPVSFVGSIAFNYENILRETASEFGITLQEVIEHPMNGLIEYHSRHLFSN